MAGIFTYLMIPAKNSQFSNFSIHFNQVSLDITFLVQPKVLFPTSALS